MGRQNRFAQEVRERAVRTVFGHRGDDGSRWEAIRSIAKKIGCWAEALRTWVRRTQVRRARMDAGEKPAISVRRRLERLAGEIRLLRREVSGRNTELEEHPKMIDSRAA